LLLGKAAQREQRQIISEASQSGSISANSLRPRFKKEKSGRPEKPAAIV